MWDKKSIIYVWLWTFTNRDYVRFGANHLSKTYDIKIWVIKDYNSLNDFAFSGIVRPYEGKNIEIIDIRELLRRVTMMNKSLFYLIVPMEKTEIINIFAKARVRYIILAGYSPFPEECDLVKKSCQNKINKTHRKSIVNRLSERIHREINPPLKIYTSTKESSRIHVGNAWERYTDISYIHSLDFDSVIQNNRQNISPSDEIILYCDGGWADVNYDYKLFHLRNGVYENRIDFYNKMEKLFCRLEAYTGKPVVIAGHPHAKYDDQSFCGRKVIINKTDKLIPKSEMVVITSTTMVAMVMYYDKKILPICADEMKEMDRLDGLNYYDFINLWDAKYLGCTPYNISWVNQDPIEYIREIDSRIKCDYINKYMTSGNYDQSLLIEVIERDLQSIE